MEPARPTSCRSPAGVALLVAVAMVLANLFEPLTVDDCAHHYYAEQVARHPTAPFEFTSQRKRSPRNGGPNHQK